MTEKRTGAERRRQKAEIKRAVGAWSRNQRRASREAREYLKTALARLDELYAGERGYVLDELKTALRGIGHMLDDIESGEDGDLPKPPVGAG